MKSGPRLAALQISKYLKNDSEPLDCQQFLMSIIMGEGWFSDSVEAAEKAEAWKDRFLIQVRQYYNEQISTGVTPLYCFNSVTDYYIQGSCYCEPSDCDAVRSAKRKRAYSQTVEEAFTDLTPPEFEQLCGKILSLLGVREPVVTRSSGDQGIDFFGKLAIGTFLLPNVLTPGAESQLEIWLVGQAKRYQAMTVSSADIRELVGSVTLAKTKTYARSDNPLQALDIRVCDPVFYLFFTTGKLSTATRILLKKSGVVGMDGTQLSTFLCDHGVAQGDGHFNVNTFREWLHP